MVGSQLALAFGLLGTATVAEGTTAPQVVRIDTVVIGNGNIRLAFTHLQRGGLVIFKVRNSSARPVKFEIFPLTIGSGAVQGAYGFRTKLLRPGRLANFQVEFQLRGVFKYQSIDGNGKPLVKGRFVVT